MTRRLRQILFFLVSATIGYVVGNGPLADLVVDFGNLCGVLWNTERASRAQSGILPLLVVGYLLGQGIYLLARQLYSRIGSLRARRTEALAVWDPSVLLGTRFGLHQYLLRCREWAEEDPTSRLPTLALFKIRGLGTLNDERGTLVTTQLMQRVAVELRAAALPESTGALQRFLAHYLPRPITPARGKLPPARYPARWSGATFALAFRELDAVQACSIAREVAAWIGHELASLESQSNLSVSAAVAVGTAAVQGRALTSAAAKTLASSSRGSVLVLVDASDSRAVLIEQLTGVTVKTVDPGALVGEDSLSPSNASSGRGQLVPWLGTWGPGLGCVLGAVLFLGLSGAKHNARTGNFGWPDNLTELQMVDANGPRTVRLMRTTLRGRATSTWQISDATLVQGDPASGDYGPYQIRLGVKNLSTSSFYVSLYDFVAIDSSGREWPFDPYRVIRQQNSFAGRWLGPGESWSGWLAAVRGSAPISELRFQPDRHTRIELRAAENPAP